MVWRIRVWDQFTFSLCSYFPKGIFLSGNFPSDNFRIRSLSKRKRSAPYQVPVTALDPIAHVSRSARPPMQGLTYNLWEVVKWEIVTWEVALNYITLMLLLKTYFKEMFIVEDDIVCLERRQFIKIYFLFLTLFFNFLFSPCLFPLFHSFLTLKGNISFPLTFSSPFLPFIMTSSCGKRPSRQYCKLLKPYKQARQFDICFYIVKKDVKQDLKMPKICISLWQRTKGIFD